MAGARARLIFALLCSLLACSAAAPEFLSCPTDDVLLDALPDQDYALLDFDWLIADASGLLVVNKTESLRYDVGVSHPSFSSLLPGTLLQVTCEFRVIVSDRQAPEVFCPAPQTIVTSGDDLNTADFGALCSSQNVEARDAGELAVGSACIISAWDNVVDSVSFSAVPSEFEVGQHNVVVTATDGAGNTAQCLFSVTVVFNEAEAARRLAEAQAELVAAAKSDFETAMSSIKNNLTDSEASTLNDALANFVDTLDPADDEGVAAAATSLAAIADVGAANLDASAQTKLVHSASKLTGLRRQRAAGFLQTASSTCGDGICQLEFEGCDKCASDCGLCEVTTGVGAAEEATVARRWEPQLTGFGVVPVSVQGDTTTVGAVTVSALSSAAVAASPASYGNPDVVSTGSFAGASFAVTAPGAPAGTAPELAVAFNLSAINRPLLPTTSFDMLRYDTTSGTWVNDAGCSSPGASAETSFDFAASTVTVNVCAVGQVALFVDKANGLRSVESNVLGSLGSLVKANNAQKANCSSDNEAEEGTTTTPAPTTGPKVSEEQAATIGQAATEAASRVGKTMALGLSDGDGPVEVSANGVKATALVAGRANLGGREAATKGADGRKAFAAKFPQGFTPPVGNGGSGVSVVTVTFDHSPFPTCASAAAATAAGGAQGDEEEATGGLSSDAGSVAVFEFGLADDSGADLAIQDLDEPINITITAPPSASVNRSDVVRTCKFWDATNKVWSTKGVTTIVDPDDDIVTCRTVHLSSYSISFTISPPSIGLSNFDPSQSRVIYITYGILFGFVIFAAIYSHFERRRYDERQLMIERGEIEDEPEDIQSSGDDVAPREGWTSYCCIRWVANCCQRLPDQHSWVALFWPSGKKVFPKRNMKVMALVATFSLAGGLDAVFAYTATQHAVDGQAKTVNTAVIAGFRMPMDGVYAFLISLPFLLTLSLCLGVYSAYMDVLRKVAPRRFRALNATIKQAMEQRGVPVTALETEARRKLKLQARRALKNKRRGLGEYVGSTSDISDISDDVSSEFADDSYLQVGWQEQPAVIDGKGVVPHRQDSLCDIELDYFVNTQPTSNDVVLNIDDSSPGLHRADSLVDLGSDNGSDVALLEQPALKRTDSLLGQQALKRTDSLLGQQALTRSDSLIGDSTLLDPEKLTRTDSKRRQEQEEQRQRDLRLLAQNEFSVEVEGLVDRMRFWRRMSYAVGIVLFIGGMLLTFFWMGSLDTDQQTRWLQSFATFEAISVFISAPLFIAIASAVQAWKQRRKLLEELDNGGEEPSLENADKHLKTATKGDIKDDMAGEVKETLMQELGANMMSFNFF